MSNQFGEMTHDAIRAQAKQLSVTLNATTGELAICLHYINQKRHWEQWGFESPDAYAEEELAIGRNSLREYLRAGKVAAEQGLSLEQIRVLGKTKLALLTEVAASSQMTAALEYALKHPAADLKDYCQRIMKGSRVIPDRTVKSWTVKIAADNFEEAQRLVKMIELENQTRITGDAVLIALRAYWAQSPRVVKAA